MTVQDRRDPKGLIASVARNPDIESLRSLFKEVTAVWPYPMRHDECYTVSAFEDLGYAIGPEVAFILIPHAAKLSLEQNDAQLRETALSLLSDLTRRSNTTELPRGLMEILPRLTEISPGSLYLKNICEWYRLA